MNRSAIAMAAVLILLPIASHTSAVERQRAPFTLYLTEIVRHGSARNGPGEVAMQTIVAQRSDGARSETTHNFPGRALEHSVRSIHLPDMTLVRAWDSVGLKTTGTPIPADVTERLRLRWPLPESDCATDGAGRPAHPLGNRKASKSAMRGLEAVQFSQASPASEIWYAPALSCEEVYRIATFADSTSEKVMMGYRFGEPDAKLFAVSSLREAPSAEAMELNYRKAGYPEKVIQETVAKIRANSTR